MMTPNVAAVTPTDTYPIQLDAKTRGQIMLPFGLHQINAGRCFFTKGVVDIDGAGTVVYFMFRTPSTPVRIYANATVSGEAEFLVEICEDGEVSDLGTPVATFNCDRNSPNVGTLLAYASPTVTDDGTVIWSTRLGSGRTPSGVSPMLNYQIIAKPNSNYLWKITKAAAGTHYLDYDFWWHEFTPLG